MSYFDWDPREEDPDSWMYEPVYEDGDSNDYELVWCEEDNDWRTKREMKDRGLSWI